MTKDEKEKSEDLQKGVESAETKKPDNNLQDPGESPGPIPYERFKQVNERAKELENRLSELEKEQSKREKELEEQRQEKLKEQQKYKELAEDFETKYNEVLPDYESAKSKLSELELILEKYSDSQLEIVPEIFRDVVRKMPLVDRLNWLTENAEKLGKEKPKGVPKTPEGQRKSELSEDERRKRAARTF